MRPSITVMEVSPNTKWVRWIVSETIVRAEPFRHNINAFRRKRQARPPVSAVDQQFLLHLKGCNRAHGFGGELQNVRAFEDVGKRWGR